MKYVTEGDDGFRWFMEDILLKSEFSYEADIPQIKNIRMSSNYARQNITYHCKNSYASKDDFGSHMTYIKLMSSTEDELHVNANRRNRLSVLQDGCSKKDNS